MSNRIVSPDVSFAEIDGKVNEGVRLGREEARWLWENATDAELR